MPPGDVALEVLELRYNLVLVLTAEEYLGSIAGSPGSGAGALGPPVDEVG